jgi:hypothetical protein
VAEAGGEWAQGQPGLHSEFPATLASIIGRSCLNQSNKQVNKKQGEKQNNKNPNILLYKGGHLKGLEAPVSLLSTKPFFVVIKVWTS